jgi:hypothetical protein
MGPVYWSEFWHLFRVKMHPMDNLFDSLTIACSLGLYERFDNKCNSPKKALCAELDRKKLLPSFEEELEAI